VKEALDELESEIKVRVPFICCLFEFLRVLRAFAVNGFVNREGAKDAKRKTNKGVRFPYEKREPDPLVPIEEMKPRISRIARTREEPFPIRGIREIRGLILWQKAKAETKGTRPFNWRQIKGRVPFIVP